MLDGHHEFKGTHHEHDRIGGSKELPDLDGSMGRRADSAAACAGRELIHRPRALSNKFLFPPRRTQLSKIASTFPRRKPVFPKAISRPKEFAHAGQMR